MTQGTSVSRGESKDISILILLLEITIKDNKEKNPTLVKLTDICNPESQRLKRENPWRKAKDIAEQRKV